MRSTFDGERAFSCLLCDDTGLVEVWSPVIASWFDANYRDGLPADWRLDPKTIAARNNPSFRPAWSKSRMTLGADTWILACTCRLGDAYMNQSRSGEELHRRFDPLNYCRYHHGDERKLHAWVLEMARPKSMDERPAWQPDEGGYARAVQGEF